MLSFKKFLSRKTKEGHVIIDEPVHFRMDQPPLVKKTKEGHVIVDEPIHFRMGQSPLGKKLEEKNLIDIRNKNAEDHGHDDDLSEKLHHATASTMTRDDRKSMFDYTRYDNDKNQNGSKSLNMSLAKGEKIQHEDEHIHNTIMKHAKASGHEVHLLSGTGRNFEHMAKDTKDGVFHFPAHTSMTHHVGTAKEFAFNKKHVRNDMHMIHVHVKPKDKILHISKHSEVHSEHETILPAGTKLKYHGTTEQNTIDGDTYKIHHMTVHSQE